MHVLAERLLSSIRRDEMLHPGDRVGVAVSGGIDSVALFRLLLELRRDLGIVLSVIHFNHKLRGTESDTDQEFVAALAGEHGLEFHLASGDPTQLAAKEHSGLEAAARELRYGFFRELLGAGASSDEPAHANLGKIATGHTLNDQAETVLMRLIRGTGLRGLGGIHPRIVVEDDDGQEKGEIIRPLLAIRRRELQHYLEDIKQPWREDSTNAEVAFTRNRVRQLVMPLLEKEFNPAVAENFAELAAIARDEDDYWENEVSGWLGTVVQWSEPEWAREDVGLVQIQPLVNASSGDDSALKKQIAEAPWLVMNASVSRPWLLTEPRAVQRRVLKAIGDEAGIPLEFKHIEEMLRFAGEAGTPGKELSLPLGWKLIREPEAMTFITPDLRQRQEPVADYQYVLEVPGRLLVPELASVIEAFRVTPEAEVAEYNSQQLLRAELLTGKLVLRNWRAGDRYWPAHTKSPKKVKELLQAKHVDQPERRLWPVMVSGNEIIWMRGFPVPARCLAKAGEDAVLIREVPWTVQEDAI